MSGHGFRSHAARLVSAPRHSRAKASRNFEQLSSADPDAQKQESDARFSAIDKWHGDERWPSMSPISEDADTLGCVTCARSEPRGRKRGQIAGLLQWVLRQKLSVQFERAADRWRDKNFTHPALPAAENAVRSASRVAGENRPYNRNSPGEKKKGWNMAWSTRKLGRLRGSSERDSQERQKRLETGISVEHGTSGMTQDYDPCSLALTASKRLRQ